MSNLKNTLDALKENNSKIFAEQYSVTGNDWGEFYEPETDEVDEAITGMDGNTQQIFSLHIFPARVHGIPANTYIVEARYFKQMNARAIVPGKKLLDFLLHARIVVSAEHKMTFEHPNLVK